MSRRAYAAARGVDEAAIRKAIRSGRIVPNAAGLIDPDQADANWWRYSQRNPQTYATADSSIAWRRPGAAWLAGSIREALSPQLRAPARMPSQFSTPDGEALVRRWSATAAALLADPEAEV